MKNYNKKKCGNNGENLEKNDNEKLPNNFLKKYKK